MRLILLPALTLPAASLEIRSYNAAVHDRFTGFNSALPVMNPSFLHDATKFTGLGWFSTGGHKQPALVSPRHFLWATHHVDVPVVGSVIRFVSSSGTIVQRTATAFTPLASDASGTCDLAIATFDSALPPTVKPFRMLNLGSDAAYLGTNLMVFGYNPSGAGPRAGHGLITGFRTQDIDGTGPQGATEFYRFDYLSAAGLPNDAHVTLAGGDSGTPSFASVSGEPVLVGLHSFYLTPPGIVENYDSFIPHYTAKLDAEMELLGYRMRPANYTATTLSFASETDPTELRQAYPGTVKFTFANSGAQLTGNAEMTLTFAAGEAPASLAAPGWVVESTGTGSWSIRKATMAAATGIEVEATWPAMPNVASLAVAATIQSDTVAESSHTPFFTLKPTYAAWASGLAEAAQDDDPDQDGMVNLLEYAFGGDALSGSGTLPSGHSIHPQVSYQAGNVTLSYPERSDAEVRGISYIVETASDPGSLAGSVAPPAGAVSTTEAFVPAVPGFVKRVITWPADGPLRFARVKVELSE